MIMPSKYLREDEALIGVSAALIPFIDKNKNLSDLWEKVKDIRTVGNYERFVLALDLLFMFGLIEIHDNEIVRVRL